MTKSEAITYEADAEALQLKMNEAAALATGFAEPVGIYLQRGKNENSDGLHVKVLGVGHGELRRVVFPEQARLGV